MIFLRNESFKQYIRLYPVISCILAIHIVMFLLLELNGGSENNWTLLQYGAMTSHPAFAHEKWRFFTSIVLHAGFLHLLFNSFALYVFAPPIERLLGPFNFAALYVLCGVGGNIVSYLSHVNQFPAYVGVGASGAIFGIYGAYMYIAAFRKQALDLQSRKTILTLLIVGVIYSLIVPNVDLYAHLGGFIVGFILFPFIIRLKFGQQQRRR